MHNFCCFVGTSFSSSTLLSCKVKQRSSLVLFCSFLSVRLKIYSKKGRVVELIYFRLDYESYSISFFKGVQSGNTFVHRGH